VAVIDLAHKLNIPVPELILCPPDPKTKPRSVKGRLPEEISAVLRETCKAHHVSLEDFFSRSKRIAIVAARREAAIQLRFMGLSMGHIAVALRRDPSCVRWYFSDTSKLHKLKPGQVKPYNRLPRERCNPLSLDYEGRISVLERQVAEQTNLIEELKGLITKAGGVQ
jgi:hypothetical protein